MAQDSLSMSAKALLVASMLSKDGLISQNGKGFLKELILRQDERIDAAMALFEAQGEGEASVIDVLTELIDGEAFSLYTELFEGCTLENGKAMSKKERDDGGMRDKSLIYGEVDYFSFATILRKINPEPGAVFYDLGSGTGKALFVARFTCDFGRCTGIEILEGLSGAAAAVTATYDAEFREFLSAAQPQEVTTHHGSFLDFDWSDGHVVFANSTCFEDSLMKDLSAAAARLAPGAYVITFTKGLDSEAFEVLFKKRYDMSWGPATVWIHRRLRHDGSSVAGTVGSGSITGEMEDDEDDDEDDEDDDDLDDDDDTDDDEDDEDAEDAEGEGLDDSVGFEGAGDADDRERREPENGNGTPRASVYTYRQSSPVTRVAQMYGQGNLSSPQDAALMRRKRAHH